MIDTVQTLDEIIAARNAVLREKNIDRQIIRKAWFTISHLLLDDDAHVVDMGCDEGEMTFVMALMNPRLHFTGLDKNKRKINKAKAQYKLDNLDFKIGDASSSVFGKESVDAIINSYVLHEIYSASLYNEEIVADTLEQHHKMLKKGGQLFVRDYARPPPGEFVLMEMPDIESKGEALKDLSEADLLVWYAEHARPKHDPGCGGFFLEELPPQFPQTRLFKLPYKWAYEFIMRKDDRQHWETELPIEYTFFTKREMRKKLWSLGMRTRYAAPFWDDDIIAESMEGKFRLYTDTGEPLDFPPVCYTAVATKVPERRSMQVHERRPSQEMTNSKIAVTTLRNESTGELVDVARRNVETSEVIPYRVTDEGRLKIFLHDGLVRTMTNAVPRSGNELQDQRWSGHMIEAISVEAHEIPERDAVDTPATATFAKDYLGLKPSGQSLLEFGPEYYPSPDYIDERIQTVYLSVEQARKAIKPGKSLFALYKFQEKGDIKEFDAQQILDAVSIGMIPNARLELQILALFSQLGLKAENWTTKSIKFEIGELKTRKSLKSILDYTGQDNVKFSDDKGTAEQLREMRSIFVEEGQNKGATAGLSFEDVDFIVHNKETINVATVLPLAKDIRGEIHASFNLDHLPVPSRHDGKSLTIAAQRYNLPPEVTNLRLAKKFIAEKYKVKPENVIKLGEPYFTHLGLTPQKIYPFAIVVPAKAASGTKNPFLPFYQMMLLRKSLSKDTHFMTLIARAYRLLNDQLRLEAKMRVSHIVKDRFDYHKPEWSIPTTYHRSPALPEPTYQSKEELEEQIKKYKELKETPKRVIKLQETLPPNFTMPTPAEANSTVAEKVTDKVKDMIKPLLKKTDPVNAPQLAEDFEKEFDAFIEDLDALDKDNEPRPEKW